MADISTYLAQILSAVYGEDVRGSIHDAIEIINDVSEVVLTTGTAVTGPTSSSEGFYDDSLYLNTSTMELWKCVGTDSWASQGILKGDDGDPGQDGNKWYLGTGISGKAANPTVYSGSGVADANVNDFYLNPVEGAVYHCVSGGDASTATWSYDFTMSGGGGGDTVSWNQIQTSTGATKIAIITINGTAIDVYAPTGGGGGSSTLAGLTDVSLTSLANNQMLVYDNSASKWKNQNQPSIPDGLSDLTDDVAISTPSDGQVLQYDGANSKWKNQTFSGGHQMIAVTDDINTIKALANGNDNYVINAYTAKRWSNVDGLTLYTTAAKDTDTIGSWTDTWKTDGDREGWLWHSELNGILSRSDIEIEPVFDVAGEEVVSIYAYRIDDSVTKDGTPGGAIAIKLNSPIQNASGVMIGFKITKNRTANVQLVPIPPS